MFRVLQLNIEVDVVTSSTFHLEGSSCENLIVMYLSTQIGFLIGWLNMSRAVNKNTLTFFFLSPRGDNNFNFRLSRDKVVHRETAANVCASLRTKRDFWQLYSVWDVSENIFKIKIKITGPTGNNEDCFPLPQNGTKKKYL